MDNSEIITSILNRKPYLRGYFFSEGFDASFRIGSADNGSPLLWDASGKPLSSRFDPDREASRAMPPDAHTWSARQIVLLLGLGNPLFLERAVASLKPDQICIAVDSRFELGAFLCRNDPNILRFLDRPGCHLFCGEAMLEAFFTYIDSLPSEGLKGIRIIRHAGSISREPEFYRACEERIRSVMKARLSDLLTRFEFENLWIKNILINSRYFPEKMEDGTEPDQLNVASYAGILNGMPGVLVAAGPSLRRSLDTLRTLRTRAFILSCDTSCKVLLNNGIVPHGVITLDSQKNTLFHFLGADLSDSILFADIVANPLVLRCAEPDGIVFSTTAKVVTSHDGKIRRETTPGTEYIESFYGQLGSLQSGGSVATSGYDLLRNLGAGSIMLIGQDLAYTGREIHCTGTHHNERWLHQVSRSKSLEWINESIIRKRELAHVPAKAGGEVLTDHVLNLYRHWFEEAIRVSGLPTYNLTADGARIDGALTVEDAEAFAASLPVHPELASLAFKKGKPTIHRRPFDSSFYADLAHAVDADNFDPLFNRHPWLRPIVRRAEIYLKRNRQKMADERVERVYHDNVRKAIAKLKRSIEPYFAD
jgi:hypothetical protein